MTVDVWPTPARRPPRWADDMTDGHPLARSLRLHQSRSRLSDTFANMEADVQAGLGLGQFLLLYQPRFSLETGDVVAIEALLRWRDSTRGLLGPKAFLPLVSQTSVMVSLGRWVLQEAAFEARRWEQQRPDDASPLMVSVNVAAREVLEPGFIDGAQAIVDDSGLPIELFQLEVDAEDPLRGETAVAKRLQLLRQLGMRIALDGASPGLGVGSDLIDADSVHLHRRWVRGIDRDADLTDAVSALVERVHRSGGQLCAMGVEDQRQADALTSLGCDHAQGFFLCHPVEPEALGWVDDDT